MPSPGLSMSPYLDDVHYNQCMDEFNALLSAYADAYPDRTSVVGAVGQAIGDCFNNPSRMLSTDLCFTNEGLRITLRPTRLCLDLCDMLRRLTPPAHIYKRLEFEVSGRVAGMTPTLVAERATQPQEVR